MDADASPQILDVDTYAALWKSRWFEYRDFLRGRWHRKFKADVAILRNFIPPRSLVIDAGSNHGRFAIEVADLHDGDARCSVLAFEPVTYNFRVQSKVLGTRENVTAFHHGLSDVEAEFEIFVPLKPTGALFHGGAFIANLDELEQRLGQRDDLAYVRQRIACMPLDQVDAARNETVAFLKIDVEGHELEVLNGALSILTRDQPTIMIESRGEAAPLQLLADLGYHFFDLDLCDGGAWTKTPGDLTARIVASGKHHDILCWHPGSQGLKEAPGFAISFAETRYGT